MEGVIELGGDANSRGSLQRSGTILIHVGIYYVENLVRSVRVTPK